MNSSQNSTAVPRVATIDDIQSDLGHLSLLLDTAVSTLMEMDFGVGEDRNHPLDRLNALTWIARDIAEKLATDCDPIAANRQAAGGATARIPPTLNVNDWSVTDLEQAYAGLVSMADAGNHILCQPRSMRDGVNNYIPGAGFIENVITDWIDWQVTAIIDHAKATRFLDPDHDHRRVKLLMKFELDYPSMELPALIKMALEQSAGRASA